MVAVRRLAVLAFAGVLAACLAAPAGARPAGSYPETVTTDHFQIHFTGDDPEHATYQQAADLAASAERAYAKIVTEWGYPAPLDDGDGRTDVWIQDLSAAGAAGFASPDGPGSTSTAWIAIDLAAVGWADTIAHELMHAIQFGQWIPADSWLLEGAAEWASFAATDYRPGGGSLAQSIHSPDLALDCVGAACGNDLYETGGYSRWTFFEYLSDRYGNAFMRDVLARGASVANPLLGGRALLEAELTARGTSLAAVYAAYSDVALVGGYDVSELRGLPPATYATVTTGAVSGALPVTRVAVNHLATRFLKLRRGSAPGLCHPATLTLTVALPAGVNARPAFFSSTAGSAAIPFAVSGSTATLTVPWDTCFGSADGYVSLPNASLTLDARDFVVSGTLNVDATRIAVAQSAPSPLWTGPTVDAPAGEVAPSIFVYGAQLLRVSSATRAVRLIVFSSGPGRLQASLGSSALGTFSLRAGNNDVRFRLPAAAVRALRSTASARAGASVLSLTSLSAQGAKGTTVTRRLAIVRPKR